MPAPLQTPLEDLALRWRDLAERRRLYLVHLYDTGRWRHYYSPEQLVVELRTVLGLLDRWSELAGRPATAPDVSDQALAAPPLKLAA